jgi:hypothetical protein
MGDLPKKKGLEPYLIFALGSICLGGKWYLKSVFFFFLYDGK